MMITRQVRCKKCGEMFPLTYPEKLSDIWPGCYFLLSAVFTHGNLKK